jgi:S1-C subfamily serine protease
MAAESFCPSCWARVPAGSARCAECNKPLSAFPTQKPAPPPLPAAPRPATRSRDRDDEDELPRRRRRPVEDHDDREPEPGGSGGLLIGVLVAGGLLFVALAAGGAYLLFGRSAKPANDAVAAGPAPVQAPVENAVRPGPQDPPPVKPAAPPIQGNPIAAIKSSTVYIRCTHTRAKSSGSGFFAGKPGYVVTNAHVIGQMPAQTREERMIGPVQKIEVVVHSGQPDERTFVARVHGFDREHDLALLSIDGPNLPPPLEFGSATGLTETDEVFIFGYPLGEQLSKDISVNRSTVSSLRREQGVVQLGGGMNPGNSGGPVTNKGGQVVGVSVAKILGTDIDFAIPAERAAAFVRKQLETGGNAPAQLAGGPPPVGPPAFDPPPVGPPAGPFGPGLRRPRPGGPEMPVQPGGPVGDPEGLKPSRPAPGGGPKPILNATGDKPRMLGFGLGPEFRELAPKDGVLVGLELRLQEDFNKYLVRQVRPIYRVGVEEVFGEQRGNATGPTVTLKAKPGYAVGAMIAKGALAVDGLSLVFMKVKDKRLDTADSYESDWAGGSPAELQATKLDGGGMPAVGLVGRADDRNLIALATVFRGQEDAVGVFPPAGTKHTPIIGGGDMEFQDVAPDGGLLVGFQFGMGKFVNNEVIHYVRPIYEVAGKEKLGKPYGGNFDDIKKVKAKPGYAVGAISMKTGLGLDGVTVTFMKIDGDHLDPSDRYDSEYVGGPGGGGPHKVGGDGSLVVGVIGKRNAKEVGGLGLVVKK